jgi:hypothetical protein
MSFIRSDEFRAVAVRLGVAQLSAAHQTEYDAFKRKFDDRRQELGAERNPSWPR